MTLIIALSVFNGLETKLRELFGAFDPDLLIIPAKGKTFTYSESLLRQIEKVPGVASVIEVIEDNALVRYKGSQTVARIKGVSDQFIKSNRLGPHIVAGDLMLKKGDINYAIVGLGIQYKLSLSLNSDFYALQIFYPKKGDVQIDRPERLLSQKNILPIGSFSIEKQYDEQYIYVPIRFAKKLFDYQMVRTALEIQLDDGANAARTQKLLKQMLGPVFQVKNGDEQHQGLFRAIKIEKLFVFLVFSFLIIITSTNIFFLLSIMAIEKKHDIAVLYTMGATSGMIKRIFLLNGMFISVLGSLTGVGLGVLVCWVQEKYGLISMGMQTSVMDAYPVKVIGSDLLLIGASIVLITLLVSIRPAILASRSRSLVK